MVFRRFWVVGVGWDNRIRRDIFLPSFPRRRESTFEFRQLFLNICFLGFPMDSRLRGNDGCWRYRGFCLHSLYFLKCRSRSGDVGTVAWALPTNNDCLKHKKVV
ncbi:hypothetical protein NEISICOT_00271 [Neisseria sicca ATCC 29256]|uniref:Uncharacterized protein n=1 Tax=Neisseria sicca ATCC 29256 TaxID=547045 RepID=C6M192_NEISI|nr:hypothetical protein NEISICOT_00271 [Neisseria sicca ATCC 29256]